MAKVAFGPTRQAADREKIWRHSRLAGYCEGTFWRPFDKAEGKRLLRGAELFELHTRKPGRRTGALGHIGIEVLRAMIRLICWKTGRLEPSLDTLSKLLKRSKRAVVAARDRLRKAGFLDWIRRYTATGREGFGPQVQQTSNAYRLNLPKVVERLLGSWGKEPPVSDDLAAGAAERTRQDNVFVAQASGLDAALSRLGAGVNQRESTRRHESPTGYLFEPGDEKKSGVAAPPRPD